MCALNPTIDLVNSRCSAHLDILLTLAFISRFLPTFVCTSIEAIFKPNPIFCIRYCLHVVYLNVPGFIVIFPHLVKICFWSLVYIVSLYCLLSPCLPLSHTNNHVWKYIPYSLITCIYQNAKEWRYCSRHILPHTRRRSRPLLVLCSYTTHVGRRSTTFLCWEKANKNSKVWKSSSRSLKCRQQTKENHNKQVWKAGKHPTISGIDKNRSTIIYLFLELGSASVNSEENLKSAMRGGASG